MMADAARACPVRDRPFRETPREKCMSQSGGAIKQQFIGFPIVGISMWIR